MTKIKPEWLIKPEQLTDPKKYGSIAKFNARGALEVAALKLKPQDDTPPQQGWASSARKETW